MNSVSRNLFKLNFLAVCGNQSSVLCNNYERFTPKTIIPSRNTFILKRKYPMRLRSKGLEDSRPRLKGKDYCYELVENTETRKQEPIPIILKQYVEGLGLSGECVSVRKYEAYRKYIITGLADFATPEQVEEARKKKESQESRNYSTLTALSTVRYLQSHLLAVVMNKDVEWTLEPWHIRVAFRKAGIHVPTNAIQLPEKPIKGPNLDWELKYFCVTVTINNKEKATVRCRLHHWSTNIADRVPFVENPWALPQEAIFPEDQELISRLPIPKFKRINTSNINV
ncbi:large ribosomal subunit protein bL9m [Halyomorpha halys]|uniref:large ribosomal subunit protein bL9m n=1 Tax=Halyomorpha halys TaxID=286706 RepID=UPI0006D4FD1B|nr:39S ribosomal protein L9, mitochondrial [Halyomorpha halys]